MDDWTLDDLECKVAVKTAEGSDGWKVVGKAGRMSNRKKEPWAEEFVQGAEVGDELWWYCTADINWAHLCGRAGWAWVRCDKVIATQLCVMN